MTHFIKTIFLFCIFGLLLMGLQQYKNASISDEWTSLFDGKTLNGWKASEHPETFSVSKGKITVHGDRAHLFYVGSVNNHNFDDFAFKADVKTTKGSNSGIYFHTEYQKTGWPSKGFEVQINNSYEGDYRRTASLYGIENIKESPAKDSEWFTIYIKVVDKKVTIKVNGTTVNTYNEPENLKPDAKSLSSGTFALQGHDPGSKVFYKNIMVKPL